MQNAFLLACAVCSLHNAKRIKGINNLTFDLIRERGNWTGDDGEIFAAPSEGPK